VKKIDKLVLKAFLPPYIMAFFVAEFVLIMQFLWKYIDEIIGKGFSIGVLLELIFYFAVTLIPMAIPVTILIASVMVYGDMAEKFELSSFKSAGVSLFRVMGVGIAIAIMTSGISLIASNYLKPKAQYSFLERLYSIRRQKPALSIEKGIFNKDFSNYTIRVGDKDPDGKGIHDIKIYDQSQNDKSKVNFVTANSGEMYPEENGNAFVMHLFDGEQYRDMDSKKSKTKDASGKTNPFIRIKFGSWKKVFDMTQFELDAKSVNLSRKKFDLLNAFQIISALDSINMNRMKMTEKSKAVFSEVLGKELEEENLVKKDTLDKLVEKTERNRNFKDDRIVKQSDLIAQVNIYNYNDYDSFLETFSFSNKKKLLSKAADKTKSTRETVKKYISQRKSLELDKKWYLLRLNQQFSWALVCIIFLFIGAPLGSIVRKGGYGYPLLIAIVFFMIFIVFNIMGEKLMGSGSINPILAAWFPCLVCLPFAFILTYKAIRDESLNLLELPFFLWIRKKLSTRFSS